jgi:structural maintenance of chromosome 4
MDHLTFEQPLTVLLQQDVKNEAEAYMLKELSLLKWQEKATKLAVDDTSGKMDELQVGVATLEENLKAER